MTSATSSIPGRRGLRRPRAIGILVAAASIVGMTYVSSVLLRPATAHRSAASAPAAALGVPGAADPAAVPGSVAQLDRGIKVWAANLAAEPRDFLSATTLAALYHERGRLTGDLADHQRALEAAQTAARDRADRTGRPAARGGDPLHAPRLQRCVRGRRRALSRRPDPARRARHEGGRRARARTRRRRTGGLCRAVVPLPPVPPSTSGLPAWRPSPASRPRRSAWHAPPAMARWRRPPRARHADVGFYQFAAGEYARLAGDAASARQGYVAALAVRDTDLGALVGLARIDAFEGHTSDAIAGLEKAAAIAPQPETLALLGDLQAATGDAAAASRQFETVRFIERLGEIAEHRLRPLADPLRARPRRGIRGAAGQGPGIARRAPRHLRSRHGRLGAVSTRPVRRGRRRDRGRRGATVPPTRGCCSIAARSSWPLATRPAGVLRSRPRSRSDPRSIRSSAPRLSGSSRQ